MRLMTVLVGLVLLVLPGSAYAGPVRDLPSASVGFNAPVHALVRVGETVIVGGEFTHAIVGEQRVARAGLAAVSARTGDLLPWAPAADGPVYALAVDKSAIVVGGGFEQLNGQPRRHLGRIDINTGRLDPTLKPKVYGDIWALAVGHGRIYVGGEIKAVGSEARANLAAFSSATGDLDATWAPVADQPVRALLSMSGRIYLGGAFENLNGSSDYDHFAAVDPASGATDETFDPAIHVMVRAITPGYHGLYAALGGQGGQVLSLDENGKHHWTVTTDGDVQSIIEYGGTVYVGGHFDFVCNSSRTGEFGVCLDGSTERHKLFATDVHGQMLSWAPNANGVTGVTALVMSAGRLAVGGTFTAMRQETIEQLRFALFSS